MTMNAENSPITDTPRTDSRMTGGCVATDIVEHARTLERQLNRAIAIAEEYHLHGWAKAYVHYDSWNQASRDLKKLKQEN
jgi:hypothetical protein